jgi:hypothetical protein
VKLIVNFLTGALMMGACAWQPAEAQAVYKCAWGRYSQTPCSSKVVSTDDAPIPAKANPREVDVHRLEHNRVLAASLRRLPGESDGEFATRRHRTAMLDTDRDECARLDKRIPFEKERMKSMDTEEVIEAQLALGDSRKRFRHLKC